MTDNRFPATPGIALGTAIAAAFNATSITSIPPQDSAELRAAADEIADLMLSTLTDHVYSDDDRIPADCQLVASIQRVRAALGMVPAAIETASVYEYSATFAGEHGDRSSYSTQVLCNAPNGADNVMEAFDRGRADLDCCYPHATKVDARVTLVAEGSC